MAKPRMGRNLDALLGGSTRERADRPATAAKSSTARPTAHSRPVSTESDREAADDAPDSIVSPTPLAERAAEGDTGPVVNAEPHEQVSAGAASALSADTIEEDHSGRTDRLRMIGVDQIRRGSYQPRRLFDADLLQELSDSIKAEGMIQPIIVRPFADAFELVAGERRWRAAQLAGLAEIPAIVREMQDQSVAAVSVIENIQRKDLNPLEEAAAFERLCDEFGMTHKAVAEAVGRSRASVTNLMRLLELHDGVKVMVDRGELEMGHARAILGAPQDQQVTLARDVIKRGLTVRAVEKLVRDLISGKGQSAASGPVADPDIDRLSQKLGETLCASVRIQHKPSGRGKLEISYGSVTELQGILAHIK